jgi:hypothetical protein
VSNANNVKHHDSRVYLTKIFDKYYPKLERDLILW